MKASKDLISYFLEDFELAENIQPSTNGSGDKRTVRREVDYSVLEVPIEKMVPPQLAVHLLALHKKRLLVDIMFEMHNVAKKLFAIEPDILVYITEGLARERWPITFTPNLSTRGQLAGQEREEYVFSTEADVLAFFALSLKDVLEEKIQKKKSLERKKIEQAEAAKRKRGKPGRPKIDPSLYTSLR
ncbi:MAG: hypothetical protein QG639_631 [Patescibacteria group bacterium]|nr:hypothetical protein [Patescibacteria group bacterium]